MKYDWRYEMNLNTSKKQNFIFFLTVMMFVLFDKMIMTMLDINHTNY